MNPIRLSVPTFYFIGVSTERSSIMTVFPEWSDALGLGTVIAGYDVPLKAPREAYREVVGHIKDDPLAKGALVHQPQARPLPRERRSLRCARPLCPAL